MIFVPVFVLSLYFGIQGYVIDSNLQTFTSPRQCAMDADCVPFGKTGTCGCGCYNRTYELPKIESKGLNSGLCYCSGGSSEYFPRQSRRAGVARAIG